MSGDPAVEAVNRTYESVDDYLRYGPMLGAAREALKPIREMCDGMREMFGDDFEIHISDLAPYIYSSEELS